MSFQVGDMVLVKVSGQNALVVEAGLQECTVMLANGSEKEGIEYVSKTFPRLALEPIEGRIQREIENLLTEQKFRIKAQEEFDAWKENNAKNNLLVMPSGKVN